MLGIASGVAAGAAALAVLAGGCGRAASTVALAAGQAPAVSPSAVPGLGKVSYGTFPATWGGSNALGLCESWAGLRGQYVAHLKTDTRFQLEQWFSSRAWQAAFNASGRLAVNPGYGGITLAFGQVSTTATASIRAARLLDQACAAAS